MVSGAHSIFPNNLRCDELLLINAFLVSPCGYVPEGLEELLISHNTHCSGGGACLRRARALPEAFGYTTPGLS